MALQKTTVTDHSFDAVNAEVIAVYQAAQIQA
jgi:hypothetical protein